jgi:2,3-bisphosphoglycerate-dependent phosphoglycerate mutase
MNTFYLIRHAHADWEPDESRSLSVKGKRDAIQVAEILSEYPVTEIYSSPYRRALQTVEPLARLLEVKVQIVPELRERTLSGGVVGDFNSAVEAAWRDPTFSHPGGESNAAAQQRGISIVCKLQEMYPGADIILSTHGNLMALVMQYFVPDIDFAFWKALSMPDIYQIRIDPGGGTHIQRLWR